VKEMMQSSSYENWSFLPGMPNSESATHAHLENLKVMQAKIDQEKQNDKVRIEGQEDKLETLQKAFAIAQEAFGVIYRNQTLKSTWRELLSFRYRDTLNSLSGIRYLGPLRKYPTRIESLVEKSKNYVGREGEGSASILYRDSSTVKKVNQYMQKLNIPYEVYVVKLDADGAGILGDIIALQLVDLRSNVVLSLEDVGFGISQVLPILVQLAISESDMVLIEQPELHLHPALQAHFGDLLIDGITPDSKNQFIIETHSEHLLLRLQRRIREGILSSEDIRIYYIDANKELGSYVQLIEMDDQGEFITAWPNGFFPERLDEMLA
jgi:predicted ATPase